MRTTKRSGQDMPITPESLKAQMREDLASGNTRYGGHGERILAEYLRDRGHAVEWVHAGGIDLSIDGLTNVDVKSRLALGRSSLTRAPKVTPSQRAPGVIYPYVVFLENAIRIYECPLISDQQAIVEVSWSQGCEYLSRTFRRTRVPKTDPEGTRARQREVCRRLTEWIGTTWGFSAHVVFRGNPLAQAEMSRQGWGPESFYQDVRKSSGKFTLVVLIYFDGKEPRTVFAYPLSRSSEIQWGPKPVGPNPTGRKTFDPKALDPRFIFAGIEQFQREFLGRFL